MELLQDSSGQAESGGTGPDMQFSDARRRFPGARSEGTVGRDTGSRGRPGAGSGREKSAGRLYEKNKRITE